MIYWRRVCGESEILWSRRGDWRGSERIELHCRWHRCWSWISRAWEWERSMKIQLHSQGKWGKLSLSSAMGIWTNLESWSNNAFFEGIICTIYEFAGSIWCIYLWKLSCDWIMLSIAVSWKIVTGEVSEWDLLGCPLRILRIELMLSRKEDRRKGKAQLRNFWRGRTKAHSPWHLLPPSFPGLSSVFACIFIQQFRLWKKNRRSWLFLGRRQLSASPPLPSKH